MEIYFSEVSELDDKLLQEFDCKNQKKEKTLIIKKI